MLKWLLHYLIHHQNGHEAYQIIFKTNLNKNLTESIPLLSLLSSTNLANPKVDHLLHHSDYNNYHINRTNLHIYQKDIYNLDYL